MLRLDECRPERAGHRGAAHVEAAIGFARVHCSTGHRHRHTGRRSRDNRGVQLRFGPDDLESFASVKTQLLDEFRPWVAERYGPDDESLVADADTFLSWRVNYSNGDLSRFTPDDAEEFLLDWAPRKWVSRIAPAPI